MRNTSRKIEILRLLALAIALLFALQLLASCAKGKNYDFTIPTRTLPESAAEQKFGSYGYRMYDDGTIIITSYDGRESNLSIPANIDGKKVVAIDKEVFLFNTTIQSVSFPDTLEVIGDYAFFGAELLHSVNYGKSLWSVGLAAFDETPYIYAQTEDFVVVSDGVLIKYNGKEKSVTIPDNVKHVCAAFVQNSDIVSVRMGAGVLTVGNSAFSYCDSLKYVAFGENTRLIGEYAFDQCLSLTAIDIPDKVEIIGESAFSDCNYLLDVRLGKSVREIGSGAFYNCLRIRSITLPLALKKVGYGVFYECLSVGAVFYEGTEEQFAELGINEQNYNLRDMLKIYRVTKK